MIQILLTVILGLQFILGFVRLRWSMGLFLFIFIVLPTDIPYLDFFNLNFVRASVVIAFFNVLFYHNNKRKIIFIGKYKSYFYPILIFSLLLLPSFSFAQFSEGQFRGIYLYFTYYFIEQFLPGILILFVLRDELDFYFYFKCIVLSVFCMCLFGFYEYYTGSNPLLNWIRSVNPTGVLIEYSDESRFGFSRRVQSTAWHPIAYGGYLSMYIIVMLLFIVRSYIVKEQKKNNLLLYIIILLALANIFFTASRAPWLATVVSVALVLVYNFKYFMRRYFNLKVVLLAIITPLAGYFILQTINYLSKTSVNGSSVAQRFGQFNYISSHLGNAVYIGFGPLGIGTFYKTGKFADALGFESIIFVYLVSFGLLGLSGLIMIYYTASKNLSGKNKSYYTSFFYFILISHLIFVILSGELRTFRIFWMLYSMLYAVSRNDLLKLESQKPEQIPIDKKLT